jgi:hypothetical protein
VVNKVYEGGRTVVDMLKDGGVQLVMNTTEGAQAVEDSAAPCAPSRWPTRSPTSPRWPPATPR